MKRYLAPTLTKLAVSHPLHLYMFNNPHLLIERDYPMKLVEKMPRVCKAVIKANIFRFV